MCANRGPKHGAVARDGETSNITTQGRPILRSDERVDNVQLKDIMVGDDAARLRMMLQISCVTAVPGANGCCEAEG